MGLSLMKSWLRRRLRGVTRGERPNAVAQRGDAARRLRAAWRLAPTLAPAAILAGLAVSATGDAVGESLRPLSQPPGVTVADEPRLALRPDGALVLQVFVSQAVDHHAFVLPPIEGRAHRLVIDISEVRWSPGPPRQALPPGVRGLRFALNEPGRTRIVVDLAGPAEILSANVVPSGGDATARVEIAFRIGGPPPAPAPDGPPAQWGPPDPWSPAADPVFAPVAGASAAGGGSQLFHGGGHAAARSGAVAAGDIETASIARPAPRAPDSFAPLAAPRPTARPRRQPDPFIIVIDPGHGGRDGGASYGGVLEKDVVLEVAMDLRDRLQHRGHIHVYLTRTTDVYLTLEERVSIAERMNADLFISVHADALPGSPEVTGATIYTLRDEARDAYVASVVERETAGAHATSGQQPDWVTARLADSIGRRVTTEARVMAELFIEEFRRAGVGLIRSRPHRSANFVVLRTLDMPSVLIELGFLTSASDRDRFGDDAWRENAVEAIARAVRRWAYRDYD